MTTTLQNSIWPNDDGNLGKIKVQIPDGVNVQWPEGDALLGNCVYQNGKLVGFVDTKALTVNSSGSTTINYDYVNIELPNISESDLTINRGPRSKYFNVRYGTTFIVNPPSGGDDRFDDEGVYEDPIILTVKELQRLKSSRKVIDNVCYDANLQNIGTANTLLIGVSNDNGGASFFENCELEEFSSSLANVTNGSGMFYNARYGAETFSSGSYTNGGWLTVTTGYMGNLTNANNMFGNVYQYSAMSASTEFANLSLSIDEYDNNSKPCKITNITNLVSNRKISDATTVEAITNICKYAKLSSSQNIGEVQISSSIKNTFINNGWTTSKTRAMEPGTVQSSLYYYNDKGYWVTMDYIIPG